jgi:hypothetical protein
MVVTMASIARSGKLFMSVRLAILVRVPAR